MIEGQEVIIEGRIYRYCSFYKRLEMATNDGWGLKDGSFDEPTIACPRCQGFEFRIGYGDYECIAYCSCGHSFTIYDG